MPCHVRVLGLVNLDMASQPSLSLPHRPAHSVGFNLGVISLAIGMAGLGLAYLIDLNSNGSAPAASSDQMVARSLSGVPLVLPQSWLRGDDGGATSFAKQIDLTLALPLGPGGQRVDVDVSLMPRSRVRTSASLLDGVYLHQFTEAQVSSMPGLVGKPLSGNEGFAGETVWFDPISANPFVAKCSPSPDETRPADCLRTVYLGPGIAAVYAFPASALPQWRHFDDLLAPLMKSIGAL